MSNTNNKLPRTLRHIIEYLLNRDHFNTSICHLLKELVNRLQILSVLLYYYICPIVSCSIWFTPDAVLYKSLFAPKSTHARLSTNSRFLFYHWQNQRYQNKPPFLFYFYFMIQRLQKVPWLLSIKLLWDIKIKIIFYSHQRLKTFVFWQLIYHPCPVIPKTEFQLIN